jgi:hypothetical protein
MKLAIAYDGTIETAKGRYHLRNKVTCVNFKGVKVNEIYIMPGLREYAAENNLFSVFAPALYAQTYIKQRLDGNKTDFKKRGIGYAGKTDYFSGKGDGKL